MLDFTRFFVPEDLTSLAHTAIYAELSLAEKRRYNQCYALYLNEQTAILEQLFTPFMEATALLKWARPLQAGIAEMIREESIHAERFIEFNRRARPDLYEKTDWVFVHIPLLFSLLLRFLLKLPRWLPFPLWIILLLEERSLYYSARWAGSEVEPRFIKLHRLHAEDEDRHLELGNHLVQGLWASRPRLLRKGNARLLESVLREFFFHPKRAALRVVQVAFPNHPRLAEMQAQLLNLSKNRDFLRSLYNRTSNPLTLARLERDPDLLPVLQMLEGKRP